MNVLKTSARKSEQGFTLVELAIVMIIIGLLITGVLKGQEMIANAQVTATVSQVKAIDAAILTFQDVYDSLPGDISNAGTRVPNCTDTCDQSGDANGRIDDTGPGEAVTSASENRAAFTHMAAADLLTGISATPSATVEAGDSVPNAEVGGALGIAYTSGGTTNVDGAVSGVSLRGGHYLTIVADPTAAVSGEDAAQPLTPSQAERIDRKLDDGSPNLGSVQAGGDDACIEEGAAATDPDLYNVSEPADSCALYIQISS